MIAAHDDRLRSCSAQPLRLAHAPGERQDGAAGLDERTHGGGADETGGAAHGDDVLPLGDAVGGCGAHGFCSGLVATGAAMCLEVRSAGGGSGSWRSPGYRTCNGAQRILSHVCLTATRDSDV